MSSSEQQLILRDAHQQVIPTATSRLRQLVLGQSEDKDMPEEEEEFCPTCRRPFYRPGENLRGDYFAWLDRLTRPPRQITGGAVHPGDVLSRASFNQGYYRRFFRETRLLGRGGSGAVWLCEHRIDGDEEPLGQFAVKIVPIGDNRDWFRKRLQEVKQMCHSLSHHPNIVEYKHAWVETYSSGPFAPAVPCLFILMEWADAGSLEDNLAGCDRRGLFRQMALAVAHLHRQGLIHGDLKPSNVLLKRGADSMVALLSDFGQCRQHSGLDILSAPTTVGTFEFMPPELARRELGLGQAHAGLSSDIWSLGMCWYVMTHEGGLPFGACPLEELAALHSAEAWTTGDPLLRMMLQVDPRKRATIDEVLAAIDARGGDFRRRNIYWGVLAAVAVAVYCIWPRQ